MSGSGKDVSGVVGISRDEVGAGTFPDNYSESTYILQKSRNPLEVWALLSDNHPV